MAKKFLTPIGLPSGSSNPASAAEGELFYRSDLNAIYIFNGAEWIPQADSSTVVGILTEFGLLGGDSGTPETTSFTSTVSGGSPDTETFVAPYDGGDPS
jgi:hypothetical protein